MGAFNFAISAVLCVTPGVYVHCAENSNFILNVRENSAANVVPIPEADQQYSSTTPVHAIIVNKNGQMAQTQYIYDPEEGGVIIDNYEELDGPDSSLFFPAFGVGMLWADGYWVDQDGNYWNGNRYASVNDEHWEDRWNNYWNNDWNRKWNNYRRQHRNARNIQGQRNGNFEHRQGMDRPSNPPRGGRNFHGGDRSGGRR